MSSTFLSKLIIILSLIIISLAPWKFWTKKSEAVIGPSPFGGRILLMIPPLPPPYCPCTQYQIANVAKSPVLPWVILCLSIKRTIPLINPIPILGDWTLGLAIPNILVPNCPNTYLPILWGASLSP